MHYWIFQHVWWHHHPLLFLHTINKAIRKITEHLPKLTPDRIFFQDIPLHCLFFWYRKQDIALATIKWPGFILPSHKIKFLVPKKQVYPHHSKREAECGTPLLQPLCCPTCTTLSCSSVGCTARKGHPSNETYKAWHGGPSLPVFKVCTQSSLHVVAHCYFWDCTPSAPRYVIEKAKSLF